MSETKIQPGSLVLYKIRPAIVDAVGEKHEIRFEDGKIKRVRDKDISLLHPGPLAGLKNLGVVEGNVEEAWELLEGEQASLAEVAELVFGDYTPDTAWATWRLLNDGLYFEGSVRSLRGRKAEIVEQERQERERKAREKQEQEAFFERLRRGELQDRDRQRLVEVERLALGQTSRSRILQTLKVTESPASAHNFLLRCGYWPDVFNPWPQRQGALLESPELGVPELSNEERRDLTHLAAWAIDDEGNTDPDDAISLEGERIWVHVADVAALVTPDSHLDQAARERSANLYLPETVVTMLPPAVTDQLGLGLQEISPALSIGFRLDGSGQVADVEIVPSRVKVTRISYDQAEQRLAEAAFASLHQLAGRYRQARLARDAAEIDLPEVSVKVIDGQIRIRPLPRLLSRQMVTDLMLMAGEAAARFANEREITIPYAVQPAPQEIRQSASMAEAYAYRRLFKPSNASLTPDRHFGLGLDFYARATSPLRRYVDLVVHQQLRAYVTGGTPLDREQIAERVAAASAVTGIVRRAERLSNQHWKLIWLKRQENWRGEGVILALEERKAVVMIPELALESRIRLADGMEPDQKIELELQEVDVANQTAYFRRL